MTDFCKETLLGGGRKLISLLLCSLALTACNDDDSIIDRTGGNNLQVEVSANFHSRAPIHGSIPPDNNPIGVTLTAKDGSSYDNQNYNNIPYSATTADGKQTWMPQDKPVTLSVTEGVAMAYWPYNADAADMTAVPVETDTQTDYMYSGNVTGLSNATPKAAFQMKHAMTLIRVNVVRGTYTAEGAVTAVTAASEAFCTSGTMNVSTGALADLKGAGTPFLEEPADAAITTAGRVTEFLVLPDVTVDAASVTLGVTVDGRKYSTAIEVSEAYKQGYIYTYNLTLDNTALNVSAVAVTPWEEEISVEVPEPVAEDDQYIVQVTIDSDNYTYIHNIVNFVGVIDWGDGTTTTYDSKTSYPSHTYATAEKYLVVCSGKLNKISSGWNKPYISTKDISKLIHIGADMGITSMNAAFLGQTKLTEIPAGIFDGLTEVTDFSGAFQGCEKLNSSIPVGLFDYNTRVTEFHSVFNGCSNLTGTIPAGLFDKCTKVKNFNYAFNNCKGLIGEIPEGLFKNKLEATDFSWIFNGCKGLTGTIPANLFEGNNKAVNFARSFQNCEKLTEISKGLFKDCIKVTNFNTTFAWCTALTNIPEGLFDECTEVTDFSGTFEGCTGLTAIPTELFNNNVLTINFLNTFRNCTGLTTIPDGLFDNCPEVATFSSTFMHCTSLVEIPAGLFDNNKKVTTFQYTFYECKALESIPTGLFDYNTKVTNFDATFYSAGIISIPEGLFDNCSEVTTFKSTFNACGALTEIPANLFDNCTEVTTFESTFNGCSGITSIPVGLFDKCTEVTTFDSTFRLCKISLIPSDLFDYNTKVTIFTNTFQGNSIINIPEGLFDNCTKVTNFNGTFRQTSITEVPEGLFDKCTEVTSFRDTFGSCGKLISIPVSLFNNNRKVTDFGRDALWGGCFHYCYSLMGESPYTIINVDGNDVKVHLYERSLYPEYFAAPINYSKTFIGCKNLTDWTEITAAGWN